MQIKYHDLPFGAQLLLWTSRLSINGSCRTNPNKYDLINLAYEKVGIQKGSILLNNFLFFLKKMKILNLQPICSQCLTQIEINLICCINEHMKENINNEYFIKIWCLDNVEEHFTNSAINLAIAFKKANLNTNIDLQNKSFVHEDSLYVLNNTLH